MNTEHRTLTLPAAGTPVTVTTKANQRHSGRVRFTPDGVPWLSLQQGAGWTNIELRHIAGISITGPSRPFHMTRPAPHRYDTGRLEPAA